MKEIPLYPLRFEPTALGWPAFAEQQSPERLLGKLSGHFGRPAEVGACWCRPHGAVDLLEISLPKVS